MLDAHQLNVFLVAAETLNFTKTAKRLHMTQPSVSQHIQALEKHFGTPLFARNGRHLDLTDAGQTLVPQAREMVRASIRIEETMESLKGEVYGHLMVGCSTTPGKYVLPHLLARFHENYPEVRVTCNVTSQDNAIQMLCDGNVHIALTSTSHDFCKGAEFRKFLCDSLVLIAPLNHPWAERGVIEPHELYEEKYIMREEESGTLQAVAQGLREGNIDFHSFKTFLTLGNSEAIALSVQEGLGVGFVSKMVVDKLCENRVGIVDIDGFNLCRDIYIARQPSLPASAALTAFWEFISTFDYPYEMSQNSIFATDRIPIAPPV
ncbi:MAG: LysR family transcriptional regulator [Chloroflexi bacterium]|nr:MAG: LysR family transcriptional regulator [Chloroflexota bacterium]MBL1194176.1 LysR family transcriptional regulator [Chloroflexota bacterium]NOH11468.1 LysR family transcriptional regulator [Chloroflexota bacterium]